LVQAGFIIGTGLLLDTFLVRTITVPAMAVLVGNANWWPSRPPRPAPHGRTQSVHTPDPEPTPEAPQDDTVDAPGVGRHWKQAEAAHGTDSDVVALRS
jgi:putative drug exporter of the RND superfamily